MTDIDVLLEENRKFEPPPQFSRNANVRSPDIYDEATRDPEAFWAEQARELDWIKPWSKVLEWKPPYAKWFLGGKISQIRIGKERGPGRGLLQGQPFDRQLDVEFGVSLVFVGRERHPRDAVEEP